MTCRLRTILPLLVAGLCACGDDDGGPSDADAAIEDAAADVSDEADAGPEADHAGDAADGGGADGDGADGDGADDGDDVSDALDTTDDAEAGPPGSACGDLCAFFADCPALSVPGGAAGCGALCARLTRTVRDCVAAAGVTDDCDAAAACLAAAVPPDGCAAVCTWAGGCDDERLDAAACAAACAPASEEVVACSESALAGGSCGRLAACLVDADAVWPCASVCDWVFDDCGIVPVGGEPGCIAACESESMGAEAAACARIAQVVESCGAAPFCSDLFVP